MQISGGISITGGVSLTPSSGGSVPTPSLSNGYASGGRDPASSPYNVSNIDKFSFTSDGNAANIGDLTVARYGTAGQSSSISGYASGGGTAPTQTGGTIDKFAFASDGNATSVGSLSLARSSAAGQSSSDNGYSSGGFQAPNSPTARKNNIDKFPFASDSNATDVGDLTLARTSPAGQSSSESGYSSGGQDPGAPVNYIDKFPFASNANATDVGDLSLPIGGAAGQSSSASGYIAGGYSPTQSPTILTNIEKFPFASDGNATGVGDLTQGRSDCSGQSDTPNGYTSGGYAGGTPAYTNTIDKFPFASDSNATDVGDLTLARGQMSGQQG